MSALFTNRLVRRGNETEMAGVQRSSGRYLLNENSVSVTDVASTFIPVIWAEGPAPNHLFIN